MKKHQRQVGIALIEALIALLVFSLGMLAISKFNSYVVKSVGLTKARAEATRFAQGKIEELRNQATQAAVDDLTSGNDTATGISASFTRSWTVDVTDDPVTISVTVSWTGSDGKSESVVLATDYSWNNPTLSNKMGGNGSGGLSGKKPGPTGALRARNASDPATHRNSGVTDHVYTRDDGVTKELISETGEVLYVLEPDENGNARQFTKITGRVYFDLVIANQKQKQPQCNAIALSSAGYCYTTPTDRSGTLPKTTGNKYEYYEYECLTGEGWYGSVYLQFGDFHNTCGNNEDQHVVACVGDPGYTNNTFTASPVAIASARRKYYGFKPVGSDFTNVGMAEGRTYPTDGKPKPSVIGYSGVTAGGSSDYMNQYFVVTDSSVDNCTVAMGYVPGEFTRNAGVNVCIDPIEGGGTGSCPMTWPGWPGYAIGGGGETSASGSGSGGGSGGGSTCTQMAASITGPYSNGTATILSGATATSCTNQNGTSTYNCTYSAITDGSTVTVKFVRNNKTTYCGTYVHNCNATNSPNLSTSPAVTPC